MRSFATLFIVAYNPKLPPLVILQMMWIKELKMSEKLGVFGLRLRTDRTCAKRIQTPNVTYGISTEMGQGFWTSRELKAHRASKDAASTEPPAVFGMWMKDRHDCRASWSRQHLCQQTHRGYVAGPVFELPMCCTIVGAWSWVITVNEGRRRMGCFFVPQRPGLILRPTRHPVRRQG